MAWYIVDVQCSFFPGTSRARVQPLEKVSMRGWTGFRTTLLARQVQIKRILFQLSVILFTFRMVLGYLLKTMQQTTVLLYYVDCRMNVFLSFISVNLLIIVFLTSINLCLQAWERYGWFVFCQTETLLGRIVFLIK